MYDTEGAWRPAWPCAKNHHWKLFVPFVRERTQLSVAEGNQFPLDQRAQPLWGMRGDFCNCFSAEVRTLLSGPRKAGKGQTTSGSPLRFRGWRNASSFGAVGNAHPKRGMRLVGNSVRSNLFTDPAWRDREPWHGLAWFKPAFSEFQACFVCQLQLIPRWCLLAKWKSSGTDID